MATIRSSLAMYDGMTGPLRSIHKALNIVLNSFEAVQTASGNVIDVSAIQDAREELARAGAQMRAMEENIQGAEQKIRSAERAQDRFNSSVREGAGAADGLAGKFDKLKGAVAALGITAGVKNLAGLADDVTGTRARLSLIADDGGSVGNLERKLNRLDQTFTVSVSAADDGTVAEMTDRLSALEQDRAALVTVTDRGTTSALKTKFQELNKAAANREAVFTAADNGSIAALDAQINSLNREVDVTVDVTADVTDHDSVKILEQKIMASAQRSRAAYLDTANAIASMGANAGAAFATNDELIAFMEQVNKQFVIGGASAQGQAAAMLQLTQAMAAGALRGEELNSILENAPGIARAIESYMGAAEGSIKSYAEEGLVTADVVKNAMFAAADETNAKFESMPMTWAQVWTGMQNQAITILDPLLTKINEIANSDQLQGAVDGLMNSLALVVEIASSALDLITAVGGAIYENWNWLSPIILGVAGALTVYYGWQLAVNALDAVTTGIHIAMTAAQMAHAAATGILTAAKAAEIAAQNGLNAAMYACPITWIVIGIIAIVTALYAAVAAVNHFAGTSVSATGIICGVFSSAIAFIGNLLIVLCNTFFDVFALIYNLVATVANFIGNVFNDPVGAVCRLFFDLADTVLSVLQSLASAIDTIFGSNLAGAVQGWRNSLGGWVDDTFGSGTEIMAKMNAEDLHLGRFEYGAAFDLGYNFGEGLENKISDAFDFSPKDLTGNLSNNLAQQPVASPFDPSQLDSIGRNTGDTAANTAAAADTLDYLDEELAWMKDIAEREAVNRFTTAEITVDLSGMQNTIGSDMDLDGIIDGMIDGVNEAVEIAAEGVHV